MAREAEIYRKLTARMWGDEKVRALSAPQPCGQSLWVALLAGPQVGIIPGLVSIGEAGFAEQLRWSVEGFRSAFAEIERLGMARADWSARLVWVPKALQHNKPSSPSVVIGWRVTWELLPECALKEEARASMEAFLDGMGPAWRKAFAQAVGQPEAQGSEPVAQAVGQPEAQGSEPVAQAVGQPEAQGSEPVAQAVGQPEAQGSEPVAQAVGQPEAHQVAVSSKQVVEAKDPAEPGKAPVRLPAIAVPEQPPDKAAPKAKKAKPEPTPEEKACRRALAEAFIAEYKRRGGTEAFDWSAASRVGINKLSTRCGNDPAKALALLAEFVKRSEGKPFYADNLRPEFIAKEINALRLPAVAKGLGRFTPLTEPPSNVPGVEESQGRRDRERAELEADRKAHPMTPGRLAEFRRIAMGGKP